VVSLRKRLGPSAPFRVGVASSFLLLATLAVGDIGVRPADGARAAPRTSAALLLDDQTQWVVPPKASPQGASVPPAFFDLELTARDAPAGAMVEVSLYPRLRSRYAFERAARSGPRGNPLTTTAPVAYDSLPPDLRSAATVSLDLPVVQTASTGRGTRLGLACAPPTGTGTCTGVYPVVVELQRSTGKVLHRFTTFLTYVAGKSAHPLELAWVVPIDAPVSLSSHPTGPTRGIAPLGAPDASALEALIAQFRASTVPVTLDPSPETLQQLTHAGADGRAADATLAGLSVSRPSDQVLAGPYVPVDPGSLSGAGEPTEIAAQMAAGATVLRHLHVKTTSRSPWVQRGPVGSDLAGGLRGVGATQLVLPDVDLASTTKATNVGTWASTFSLSMSRGGSTTSVQAAETDTWLDGQFTSLHVDPALAATQVLADLAMVHFERPNTAAVRGMVALPPSRWVPNPVFARVLLDGLSQNPVIDPVTLSTFFASVTADGTRELLTSGRGPVLERSLARAVSRARVRLSDFDDAVAGRPAALAGLDDLLLATEAENLTARRQAAGIATFEHLLRTQLGLVTFAKKTTVTLTARTGWIPITIESRASYTLIGRLSVSGNKFVFPHESNHHAMRLDHATNVSRVDVLARTSGDLPLDVTFTSPNGRLVIARGLLTVRSTATSLVGIVLTVVALAVLVIWWARTWRSGRRKRRLRRTGELGGGAPAP
jgi:hypothetical protein